MNLFGIIGSLYGLLAIGLGAFGAHALKDALSGEMLSAFETAVRYQMYHALVLVAIAWRAETVRNSGLQTAGWLFVAGVALFSGSLYAMVFTGIRWLGAVTPLGGLCFIAGWYFVLRGFLRRA